ncbi:MAG: hydantoinase B/oxoprolinase family protein, partial [Acidimicrobiales bacterium]|nr:hydantoinase B/oxoprolinase family protein [Acidimicrobiales bacterium]
MAELDVPTISDPVLFHSVRHYFSMVAREMAVAVTHTAYSPLVSRMSGTTGDTDGAVLTAAGELIACDEHALIHMASLPTGLRFVLAKHPIETICDGDIYINNDPHQGAIHGNDTMVFQPVFVDGVLSYWAAVMAHITDIGGMSPGGITVGATSVFAEGLVIPPIKLYDAGRLNETLLELISANSRQPEETTGDVLALVSGSNVGTKAIRELVDRRGAVTVASVVSELLDYSERLTKIGIRRLRDGEYRAESWVDDDGLDLDKHYRVTTTVAVDGDQLSVDFSGTSPQARGSFNSSFSQSLTAVTYALRVYLGDIPLNEGFWRAVDIRLPLGTLVNPRRPAACNNRTASTMPAVVEVVLWSLSQALPDTEVVAGAGVPDVHAINPAGEGQYWLHFEAEWGGGGARSTKDGVDAGGTPMLGGHGSAISV